MELSKTPLTDGTWADVPELRALCERLESENLELNSELSAIYATSSSEVIQTLTDSNIRLLEIVDRQIAELKKYQQLIASLTT